MGSPTPPINYQPPSFSDLPPHLQSLAPTVFSGGAGAQASVQYPGVGATKAEVNAYKVYMGSTGNKPRQKGAHRGQSDGEGGFIQRRHSGRTGDELVGYDDALIQIHNKKIQKRFVDLLVRDGVVEEGDFGWDDIESWWGKAVDGAAKTMKADGRKLTPFDWIQAYAGVNGLTARGRKSEEKRGPFSQTNVSSNTGREIDDLDARAMADEAFSAALGKAADGKQSAALKAALNAYRVAHPEVTTSTVHDDGTGVDGRNGNQYETSSSTGGMSPDAARQIAKEQTQANPEYAEYQAAATYFPIMQQALQATANVTGA